MKRLLRIAINSLFFSFLPIISWFLLGLTIDSNLVNVFSLTYPLQFIYAVIISIFGTGANIKKERDNDPNATLSGLTLGIFVSVIIFGLFVIFVEPFISFMNMDIAIYKNFTIYSIISLFFHTVFGLLLEKYYFEEREKRANLHCVIYNILNMLFLVGLSLITKNTTIIISITLAVLGAYNIGLLIANYKKFKLKFDIFKNIKYESSNIISLLIYFVVFFLGLSNSFAYGEEYIIAINFVALITDAQWDSFNAINTVAKIDLAKSGKDFNFKRHIKNAYILDAILVASSTILFFALFSVYNVNLTIGVIILAREIFTFAIDPIYSLNIDYLQLEYSSSITAINKAVGYMLRFACSFIPSPYCLSIGGIVEAVYLLVSNQIIRSRHFKLQKDGTFIRRIVKPKAEKNV